MTDEKPLETTEQQLYELFDKVWSKHYAGIKEKGTNVLTDAENLVLWNGPDWLQDIGYWRTNLEGKR